MPRLPGRLRVEVRTPRAALGGLGTAAVAVAVLGLLLGSAVASAPSGSISAAPVKAGASGSWTTYLGSVTRHGDAAKERTITTTTARSLHELWNITTGGDIVSETMVADGRVVFGSWDGYEYGAYASNGTVIWKTFTGITPCGRGGPPYGVSSSATLLNGNVYFGGGGEYWLDLNAATGKVRWSFYTGNNSTSLNASVLGGHYNWASPLIYKGNAYIGISSACIVPFVQGRLLMVNLTTHQLVHWFNSTAPGRLGGGIWASPSLDASKGLIFVATGSFPTSVNNTSAGDDSIYALYASNLSVAGHFHVPWALEAADGDFGATPVLFTGKNGQPMVGSTNKDGYFFALHRFNFTTPAWDLQISISPSVAPAAFDGHNLYLTAARGSISGPNSPNGNVTGGTPVNGTLWSVNSSTGKVNWVDALSGASQGAPIYADGVVVATGGHELLVANASTGALLFEWNATKSFYDAATVVNGVLYIGNNDGHLYAFGVTASNSTLGNGSGAGGVPKLLLPVLGTLGSVVAVPSAASRRPPSARRRTGDDEPA